MRVIWLAVCIVVTCAAIGVMLYGLGLAGRDFMRDECPAVLPPGTGTWMCMLPDETGTRRWRKVEDGE